MALVRNPDSSNLFYVPQEDFPIVNGTNTAQLNDDGTFKLSTRSSTRPLAFNVDGTFQMGYYSLVLPAEAVQYAFDRIYVMSANEDMLASFSYNDFTTVNVWQYGKVTFFLDSQQEGLTFQVVPIPDHYEGDLSFDLRSGTSATTGYSFQSAYMEQTTYMYVINYYYQDASGSFSRTGLTSRTGDVGSTVSLTEEDKTPTQTWTGGTYVYDASRSTESTVLNNPGVSVSAYFKRQCTITYEDGAGGTAFDSQTYTSDILVSTPSFQGTPTRAGYTFAGWSPEVASTVSTSVTYTATWEREIDPEVASKLITVGQLARLLESRGLSAQALSGEDEGKLVTVGQASRAI